MPSPIVHLKIASLIWQNLSISNVPQFYLGSISPDAIHMGKNNNRAYKRLAHFWIKDKDLMKRFDMANKVYQQKRIEFNDQDFLAGYLVHVITDISWSHLVSRPFFTQMFKNIPRPEAERLYYQELENLGCKMITEISVVRKELRESRSLDFIGLLSKEEIKAWHKKTVASLDDKIDFVDQNNILTNLSVESFIKICLQLISLFFSQQFIRLAEFVQSHCQEPLIYKHVTLDKSKANC